MLIELRGITVEHRTRVLWYRVLADDNDAVIRNEWNSRNNHWKRVRCAVERRTDFITIAFVRANPSEYACCNSLILLRPSQVYISEVTRNIFRRVRALSSTRGKINGWTACSANYPKIISLKGIYIRAKYVLCNAALYVDRSIIY